MINNGEFVLSSGKDGTSGVTAFTVDVDEQGSMTGTAQGKAALLNPSASDSNWLQRKFQQYIQRAAGNVIVEYEGKQYALVADYNFLLNDANFIDSENYGFGKEIGGKIGIVQDPFGKNGKPVYLGATSPIQGGAVDHLTLGADGTLYADVFMDEVSDQGSLMFKSLFVWDAAELIKDALAAQARGQLLSKPIDRVAGQLGQIAAAKATRYDGANATQEFGWTYGIGAYSVPGVIQNLNVQHQDPLVAIGNSVNSAWDAVVVRLKQIFDYTPPNNGLTDAWGISDRAIEENIAAGNTSPNISP